MVVETTDPQRPPNSTPKRENYGQLIQEAFKDVQKQLSNLATQLNGNLTSRQNAAPPSIHSLSVDGGAGIYHAYVTDNNQNLYRGAEYTLEYSNDNWSTFHVQHLGPARESRLNLGLAGPLQFRAYSGYGSSSPPSPAVYASGPVYAGGGQAPALRPGQGSGTNFSTQGAGGYGLLPWRGSVPPKRA
jgi:hypothetical protein